MPGKRGTGYTGSGSSTVPLLSQMDNDRSVVASPEPVVSPAPLRSKAGSLPPPIDDDALAAMSYLDKQASPVKPKVAPPLSPPLQSDDMPGHFKSSFTQSKSSADRRVRAEEAEKRQGNVLTQPGKPGRAVSKTGGGKWAESSDEDEDEDEDGETSLNDEGNIKQPEDSGQGPTQLPSSNSQSTTASSHMSLGNGRPSNLRPLPDPSDGNRRTSRGLPPIPGQRSVTDMPVSSNSYNQDNQRVSSWGGPSGQEDAYAQQAQTSGPVMRPPPKASPWTANLGDDHGGNERSDQSSKFVTIEPPSHMTKAFTPHGLLQAGLQDKEDRSARKQEEVAREAGASLVNVPNKPPPPQAGLLGAISGYERDRKAAGGIGAALTERERDRRLAVSKRV